MSQPRARISAKTNSSWRVLLPPKARPVRSSRLTQISGPPSASVRRGRGSGRGGRGAARQGLEEGRQGGEAHAREGGDALGEVGAGDHAAASSTGRVARRSSRKLSRRCSAARRARAETVGVGLTTPPVVNTLPSTT